MILHGAYEGYGDGAHIKSALQTHSTSLSEAGSETKTSVKEDSPENQWLGTRPK